jgi:hypothetical protein
MVIFRLVMRWLPEVVLCQLGSGECQNKNRVSIEFKNLDDLLLGIQAYTSDVSF